MLCVPSRRACQVFNHAKSLGDILSNFNEGRLSCPSIAMYIKDFCHSIMAEILYVHGLHLVEPRCKRNRSTGRRARQTANFGGASSRFMYLRDHVLFQCHHGWQAIWHSNCCVPSYLIRQRTVQSLLVSQATRGYEATRTRHVQTESCEMCANTNPGIPTHMSKPKSKTHGQIATPLLVESIALFGCDIASSANLPPSPTPFKWSRHCVHTTRAHLSRCGCSRQAGERIP
jgi:hypothetical protein